MGNCVSHFQPGRVSNRDHPEGGDFTSGPPWLPIKEPTQSFWTFPPSPIAAHHSSDNLPTYADVVIIGSGISGASFARTLLDIDHERNNGGDPLSVVMLEAQETCSGATGRNGGHINPPLFHDYEDLKQSFGKATAQQILRFRFAHLELLLEIAKAEADDADCRKVHSVEVFFDKALFAEAKRKLSIYEADMPLGASTYRVWEAEEARKRYNLSSLAIGCIVTHAGAVHPYRFVTDILLRLLEEYPKSFKLFTQTPCTSISEPMSTNPFYSLTTPRGQMAASHVVHLTNAWVGGLVPKLADVVYGFRETMSAQRPGKALQFQAVGNDNVNNNVHEQRAYLFYDSPDLEQKDFDYLTQLPNGEHELMFGGGREGFPGTGSTGMYDVHSAAHVSGALPIYFGANNWGAEGISSATETPSGVINSGQIQSPWAAGRVKALWSGVLCISVDGFPWVGRIPMTISGRRSPTPAAMASEKSKRVRTADPGEWVTAGYSGEGMVQAWLCARALALMVLGLDNARDVQLEGSYGAGQTVDEWLPAPYRVNEVRWRNARRDWKKGLKSSGGKVPIRGGRGRMKIYQGITRIS